MNALTVTINKTELPIKEYHGQRVVTLKEIDTVHNRPDGTARRNLNANKDHFIEGTDFFVLDQPSEIRTLGFERPQGGTPQSVTLITESGYLMLVKSFTDDLAWAVQRQLVNTYFRAKGVKKKGTSSVDKTAIAEAKLNNSRARMAAEWRKLAAMVPVPEYQKICAHYASTALAGEPVLPLPETKEHTYTAEEVGKMLGVSGNKIGRIANKNHLKTPEYGVEVWDKSRSSSKQVQAWRYNQKGIDRIKEIIGQ